MQCEQQIGKMSPALESMCIDILSTFQEAHNSIEFCVFGEDLCSKKFMHHEK
jgi:hypothetical protein